MDMERAARATIARHDSDWTTKELQDWFDSQAQKYQL